MAVSYLQITTASHGAPDARELNPLKVLVSTRTHRCRIASSLSLTSDSATAKGLTFLRSSPAGRAAPSAHDTREQPVAKIPGLSLTSDSAATKGLTFFRSSPARRPTPRSKRIETLSDAPQAAR